MEGLLLYCLAVYFVFYLLNHAVMTEWLRKAIGPLAPRLLREMVSCGFCFTWWSTLALSLLVGFNYFLLCAPPVVLFMDGIYRKLRPPAEPPILPPPSR